jgi:uncharacterized protein YdaU (DUF1376 family)
MTAYAFMPLYVGDYLSDASHLTTLQHGAYLLLLMKYWRDAAPLPDDDRKLARIAHLTDDDWRSIRDDIADFFQLNGDGFWRHKRVEKELQTAKERIEQARKAGRASGQARKNPRKPRPPTGGKQPPNRRSTDVQLPSNHSPSPSPSPSDISNGGGDARAREGPKSARAVLAADGMKIANACELVLTARGLPFPRSRAIAPILGLLDQGFDLEADVLPALADCGAPRADHVSTWSFYVPQILRFITARKRHRKG